MAVHPGLPLVRVNDDDYRKGPIARLLGQDADSTWAALRKAAGSTNSAFSALLDRHQALFIAHNKVTDFAWDESKKTAQVKMRVDALETARAKDIAALNSSVALVDTHSKKISGLTTDAKGQAERLKEVEKLRTADREAAEKTVKVVDTHSEQLLASSKRVTALERAQQEIRAEHVEMHLTLTKLAQLHARFEALSADSEGDKPELLLLELAAKVSALLESREGLLASVVTLERQQERQTSEIEELREQLQGLSSRVQETAQTVGVLSSRQNEASQHQERHEAALHATYNLHTSIATTVASLGQEQQQLFEGVDRKLDLLLHQSGSPIPAKEDRPTGASLASFQDIIAHMQQLKQTLAR